MKKHGFRIFAAIMVLFLAVPCTWALQINNISEINIHGFISQGYIETTKDVQYTEDSNLGTADFNEMGINFSTDIDQNLTLGLQLFAFDLGDIGNDDLIIDWAYGDYSFNDYIGVRAGIIRVPFGLYNETREIDMVRTSILLPSGVYNEWFRETFARIRGAGIYGYLPGGFSYEVLYGKTKIEPDGGVARAFAILVNGTLRANTGQNVTANPTSTDSDYAYAGSLQWEPWFVNGLRLGASVYGTNDFSMQLSDSLAIPSPPAPAAGLTTPLTCTMDFESLEGSAFSAEYMIGNLKLAAEYSLVDIEFQGQLSSALSSAILREKTLLVGYYGSASYRIFDKAEIGAYYSELYYDKNDRDGIKQVLYFGRPDYAGWFKDACLSLRYDITPQWCVKAEYHDMDGTLVTFNDASKDWNIYALKTTFSF